MLLNAEQRRVVDSDGHCLVVACPGSGKTRVITTKIGALLARHPRSRIVAVTFTRESAAELTHRVIEEIGPQLFNAACRIGTFHSLCIRQLRNHKRLAKVAGPVEQAQMLRRAIALAGGGLSWEEATAVIEQAKGTLGSNEAQESDLYRAYEGLLAKHKVCDLYDVIRDSVRLMRSGEINPFPAKFLLIDEFQDTDDIQLQWALEHAKAGTSVTVVGDDDQSIYGWRGALGYGGMQQFKESTGAEHITLGLNYRCHAEILGAADRVIQNNTSRIAKTLVAARGPGGRVLVSRHASRVSEAADCVARIREDAVPLPAGAHLLFRHTVADKQWAVLCRNRRLLDEVEQFLQAAGIQCYRPPKESYWSRTPQSTLLALLSALDGGSSSGLDEALAHAFTKSLTRTVAQNALANVHAQVRDFSAFLHGDTGLKLDGLVAAEAKLLVDFAARVPAWRANVVNGRLNMVIRSVADWFASFEDADELANQVRAAGETVCKLQGTLSARVSALTSTTSASAGPKGVELHTMHGSKGLEFNKVWVIGADASVIPSPKSGDFEEERRLMYVAMTRAKDWLMLSSVVTEKPSPFALETGLEIGVGVPA